MSKFIDFLKSLIPNLKKSDVVANLLGLREELEEHTIPMWESLRTNNLFGDRHVYKSNWAKVKLGIFKSRTKKGTGFQSTILAVLQALPNQIQELGNLLTKNSSGQDIVISGVSYQTATILQLVDNLRFYSSYSRKFAMLLMHYEAEAGDHPPYSNAVLKRLEQEYEAYCNLTALLLTSGNALAKLISSIPTITVDASGIAETVQGDNVQPIRMGFAPSRFNLIWRIRTAIADLQADYYHEAKEEKLLLELHIVNLQTILAGSPGNAAVEKQIAYHQARLLDLTNHILELEQAYAS
jgi:hypothetical protein